MIMDIKEGKLIVFSASIPIAILSNMIRVPILIMISHFYGLEAAGPDTLVHTGSGVFVFIFGFIGLYTLGRILE